MEMATEKAHFEGKIQSSILDMVNMSIRQSNGASPATIRMVTS